VDTPTRRTAETPERSTGRKEAKAHPEVFAGKSVDQIAGDVIQS
jgi:hypothetical protein